MTDIGLLGKILILFGAVLIVFGLLFTVGGKFPWLGKLPGDIYIQKKGVTIFFPITTSILISIILSVIVVLLRRR